MYYQTELINNRDGRATFGIAYRYTGTRYEIIGLTRYMRVYPQLSRARVAAENICRRYHKQHHSQLPFTLTKA